MRIAIDASAIPRQMAGAGVYTYELVRALAEANEHDRLVVFARPGLFDDIADRTRVHVVHPRVSSRPGRLFWEQTVLPLLLRRLRIDVLHSTHHHTPVLAPGVRRVVTIHDVTFLVMPQRYPSVRRLYMETVTRASARVADAIITPSRIVRDEVIERLGVPSEQIVVVPYAAAPQFAPVAGEQVVAIRRKYQLPERYVLSVGSLEPGKNRARLILAYARLRAEGIDDCPLIVVGQAAWRYERDAELADGLGVRELVRYLGYVPSEDLPALYASATLFVFPSLYEGFGLPVLEAMASGTPVVASNTSAIPEVAGDAALLVDPRDADAIAEAIARVLSDEALRGSLRLRGLERARQFSWERTARDTLSVYEVGTAKY